MWDAMLIDWAGAALRWLHVIAGIAWIGSSFYFIHLDLSLRKHAGLPDGVGGEAWQVHGGGFYHMRKFLVAPKELPKELTWFKWEAYMTFLSGFALLVVVYWSQPEMYLIDPAVLALENWQAVAISVGGLALGWIVYDALCRSPLGRHDGALALAGFVLLVLTAWGYTHIFSGRGAFLQIGALVGTIMVASVAMTIIPNQRRIVKALLAGEKPDPVWGARGKQRSLHNNYLTLPVVFLMVSNHFPLAYGTQWNWVIIALLLIVGFAIRHFFNLMHAGKGKPWWVWGVAAVGFAAIIWLGSLGPAPIDERAGTSPPAEQVAFEEVEAIVLSRCSMCHAAEPLWPGIAAAPKGIQLENAAQIRQHASLIALNAGASRAMPPGNMTGVTQEERALLIAWYAEGAPGPQ